jgi:hypothetical protein
MSCNASPTSDELRQLRARSASDTIPRIARLSPTTGIRLICFSAIRFAARSTSSSDPQVTRLCVMHCSTRTSSGRQPTATTSMHESRSVTTLITVGSSLLVMTRTTPALASRINSAALCAVSEGMQHSTAVVMVYPIFIENSLPTIEFLCVEWAETVAIHQRLDLREPTFRPDAESTRRAPRVPGWVFGYSYDFAGARQVRPCAFIGISGIRQFKARRAVGQKTGGGLAAAEYVGDGIRPVVSTRSMWRRVRHFIDRKWR